MTAGYAMDVSCPYCGEWAELVNSAEVYDGRSYGSIWLCRPCQAWVGCHAGTDEPLGTLADAELREWRKKAHAAFDPLWQGGGWLSRTEAYRWLARRLDLQPEDCHIGRFDADLCRKAVDVCTRGEVL